MKVQLYKGTRYVTRITNSADNAESSYTWVVPYGLAARDDYRIKIISASDSSQVGFSEHPFSIQ